MNLLRIKDLDILKNRIVIKEVLEILAAAIIIAYFVIRSVVRNFREHFVINSKISIRSLKFLIKVFIKVERLTSISEYRSSYINVKNIIIFASIRIKKYYNSRY